MSLFDKEIPPEYLRILQQFRFIDDTFFAACLDGDIPCMELILRLVLQRSDIGVQSVVTQQSAQNLYGRGVRFDALARDRAGKIYNCEVQRADEGAIPRRARYNNCLVDHRELAKGAAFRELPETYIIFITEHDTIGAGLPLYHIERVIKEVQRDFGDGAHIIYVNGDCRDDTPLGRLMQDFFETDARRLHYKELAARMDFFKSDAKGVAAMCELMEKFGAEREAIGEAIGEARGEANGKAAASRSIAQKLLARSMELADIAKITSLPLDEVKRLASTMPT